MVAKEALSIVMADNGSSRGNGPTSQSVARSMGRRRFSSTLLSSAVLPLADWAPALTYPLHFPLYDEAVSRVVPDAGHRSRVALRDSILRLVDHGVIDRGKFFALYGTTGPRPREFAHVLSEPSPDEIVLTTYNASDYVNLLWPIGLATHMAANADSPLNGDSLYNLASTGGWTLGREENGGAYFDKLPIVGLTRDQEAHVVTIAKSTYRPCCNNSTFFQDCNHGSALLGVLQLGASQGLNEDELYREALAFNSFWFPDHYVRTALFFKVFGKTEWPDVDPRVVLGFDYSAGGPWKQNVAARLDTVPGLIPPKPGGSAGCGVQSRDRQSRALNR